MNNVTLMTHGKERVWLGRLASEDDYFALVNWAKQISAGSPIADLPEALAGYRFTPA
jgi:hypothetical protein